MLSLRATTALVWLIGLGFCLGNLWSSGCRALIPLTVIGTVTQMEMRREKHPGHDDVFLVWIDERMFQVDKLVYNSLAVGDQVAKKNGDKELLKKNSKSVPLKYSADFRGFLKAMPFILFVFGVVGWMANSQWFLKEPQ